MEHTINYGKSKFGRILKIKDFKSAILSLLWNFWKSLFYLELKARKFNLENSFYSIINNWRAATKFYSSRNKKVS